MHSKALTVAVVLTVMLLVLSISSSAFAAGSTVLLDGEEIDFSVAPVMINDAMMVEVRPLADALGYSVKWEQDTPQSVTLITNDGTNLVLTVDWNIMTINSEEECQLSVAPTIIAGSMFVPLRSFAEALGIKVVWDNSTSSVQLSENGYTYSNAAYSAAYAPARSLSASRGNSGHTFYFQNQSSWSLPSYGSGYCWTVSYAMLISDVIGQTVTPLDVAAVNEASGGDGSYCSHWDIVDAFGVKFVPALDTNSVYYDGRDSIAGGTKVKCSNEYEAVQALKEALDRNPAGVMVRYSDYPHTMVAVGYEGDTILFNEPMQISRSYEDESPKENIPFEETCVGKRGFNLEDMNFIQALAVK